MTHLWWAYSHAAMSYDAAPGVGRSVLFGGCCDSMALYQGDTWVLTVR